jgi:DNA adenine methylase
LGEVQSFKRFDGRRELVSEQRCRYIKIRHPEVGIVIRMLSKALGGPDAYEVEQIAQRLAHVHIDHKDFRACINSYDRPDTTFYCDPLYYGAVPYRKGIPPFMDCDHEDLAKLLANVHGKWLLTYNDHPRIRELYEGFKTYEVVTRLNTDKMATANRRPFRQLIIRNY